VLTRKRTLVVAAVLLGAAFTVQGDDKKKPAPITIALKTITPRAGVLRLGRDARGTIPKTVLALRLQQRAFLLVDLDGDGEITTDGRDGIGLDGIPFIAPLVTTVLCELGQCDLKVDAKKKKATLTPQSVDIDPTLVSQAADLTEMRLRAGLSLLRLDARASRALEKHCDYLESNGQADGHGGLEMHKEEEGKPGYSAEGAAAGAAADLAPQVASFHDALWSWYPTAWHGQAIVDPGLTTVGVAFKHGVGGLYFCDPGAPGLPVMVHPVDEALDVPCAFGARGEVPNPVPLSDYGKGCGFPVVARLPFDWKDKDAKITLADGRGQEVPGTASCPKSPATREWPANSQCAVFIPSRPLAAGTRYKAQLTVDGEEPIAWSFTTARK
jgi:hypothetical protein